MGLIISAVKIIVVLGTLITIHELGHFLVAKACKVKVHKFAIGFGPKIFMKQGKETEYTLRLIPFGGFVQLEGEEERSDDERAFNKKPIYQRILIVAAGAIVNIIFALIVYFCVAISTNLYSGTMIASLSVTSPEYKAGLRSGDIIFSVNGTDTLVGYDVQNIIEESDSDEFVFVVERDNEVKDVNVNIPVTTKGQLGIMYDRDKRVVEVVQGTPAADSELRSGDVILAVNDDVINSWEEISEKIGMLPDREITLDVRRGNEEVSLKLTTMSITNRFYNVSFNTLKPEGMDKIRYAVNETGDYFNATIEGILTIFAGKTENVSVMGPVGIADQIASTKGFSDFFYLMSAISLSLGIFNLFPIPALDGGKILFLIIEKIRRKPFEQNTEAISTLIGFGLIILMAIVVTFSDVLSFFR